jgi:hypothetical protein
VTPAASRPKGATGKAAPAAARKKAARKPATRKPGSASEPLRFRAKLETSDDGRGAWIVVPYDVFEIFGVRGRVPVRTSFNSYVHRGSMVPMRKGGGVGAHVLGLNRQVRDGAGAEIGDMIDVILERDVAPRVVEVPPDLAAALAKNSLARAGWDKFSYTHQREYVQAILGAKRPETRMRRIAECVEASIQRGRK